MIMFDLLHNSIFICGIVFLPQSIINLNKPPKQVLEWVKIFSQEIHGWVHVRVCYRNIRFLN